MATENLDYCVHFTYKLLVTCSLLQIRLWTILTRPRALTLSSSDKQTIVLQTFRLALSQGLRPSVKVIAFFVLKILVL